MYAPLVALKIGVCACALHGTGGRRASIVRLAQAEERRVGGLRLARVIKEREDVNHGGVGF